jgi:hypothetical protein
MMSRLSLLLLILSVATGAAAWPPAPGTPGGLPDDRRPLSEGPIRAGTAQDAAQVVQLYGIALSERRYADAYALWGDAGRASGVSQDAFMVAMAKYRDIHALVGRPGQVEGAAGSRYVRVPLQLYGRLKSGRRYNLIGALTLRRVSNIPGSGRAARRWHISASDMKLRP